jgi:hypothetical protein
VTEQGRALASFLSDNDSDSDSDNDNDSARVQITESVP